MFDNKYTFYITALAAPVIGTLGSHDSLIHPENCAALKNEQCIFRVSRLPFTEHPMPTQQIIWQLSSTSVSSSYI